MNKNIITIIISLLMSLQINSKTIKVPSSVMSLNWGNGWLINNKSNEGKWWRIITKGDKDPQFIISNKVNIDLNQKFIKFHCRINKLKSVSGVELRLTSDEKFKHYYTFPLPFFSDHSFNILQDNHWQTLTFGLGNAKVVGNPNSNKISKVGIFIQDNGATEMIFDMSSIEVINASHSGVLSFTFDDGYIDHYKIAKTMAEYNIQGTAYVMPRQVGSKSRYMNLKQLKELNSKYKWGVSSHHGTPYVDMKPPSVLENEIKHTLKYLKEHGFKDSAEHLAYPLGKQNRTYVLPLVKKYFKTARIASGGMETLPPSDLHLIRTYNVLDSTTPEQIKEKIQLTKKHGQWLILMFHFLVKESNKQIDYSLKKFEEVLKIAKKEKIKIMTVDQVWNKYLK